MFRKKTKTPKKKGCFRRLLSFIGGVIVIGIVLIWLMDDDDTDYISDQEIAASQDDDVDDFDLIDYLFDWYGYIPDDYYDEYDDYYDNYDDYYNSYYGDYDYDDYYGYGYDYDDYNGYDDYGYDGYDDYNDYDDYDSYDDYYGYGDYDDYYNDNHSTQTPSKPTNPQPQKPKTDQNENKSPKDPNDTPKIKPTETQPKEKITKEEYEKTTQDKRSGSEKRNKFIACAESYKGTPYVYGGTSRSGIDCSGLIFNAAKEAGLGTLPRTAKAMCSIASRISDSQREPGDLIFFQADNTISHVAIFLGDNQILHSVSDGSKTGVIVSKLSEKYWKNHYYSSGRIITD